MASIITATLHSTVARRPATFAALALAAATALAAFSSQPVLAQQPASPAPAAATVAADAPAVPDRPMQLRAGSERQRMHSQNKEQRMERWQQRRAEHMAEVKAELQLTPAQEQAWTDFTAAMQPGQRHARLDQREGMENLTTPERIDRMRAMRIQRAAEADRQGDAVKDFYAALSAPQQKTFDLQMRKQQERMYEGRTDRRGGKYQRGDSAAKAEGQGARGAKHRGEHQRQDMQRRYQYGAEKSAPSTAPAMPAAPAPAQ